MEYFTKQLIDYIDSFNEEELKRDCLDSDGYINYPYLAGRVLGMLHHLKTTAELVKEKKSPIYRFKNNKHSVEMVLDEVDEHGVFFLHNKDWPTLLYSARPEELELVEEK